IPLLLRHFMGIYAARYARPPLPVSPALVQSCLNHRWPGNLRELENFVKRYLILGDESLILSEMELQGSGHTKLEPVASMVPENGSHDLKSLVRGLKDEAESKEIARALKATKWNRKEAARQLNISYKALLYKIRQFNLDKD
ncbi:MAG: helix-turn-helix domain-containing protein, partial [Terriglobia bacterium]